MNQQLWKKAGLRALVGAPLGLAYSTMITIIISLARGDGNYYAVVPEMIADVIPSFPFAYHMIEDTLRGESTGNFFFSDHEVAYERYVTVGFPESDKMRLPTVPVRVLKSFFHIGIWDYIREALCVIRSSILRTTLLV